MFHIKITLILLLVSIVNIHSFARIGQEIVGSWVLKSSRLKSITSFDVRFFKSYQSSIISVRGNDRIRFLHSLGTNSFEDKSVGTTIPNCFLNSKGKLLDYTTSVILENEIKILCSPDSKGTLLSFLDRNLFPLDRVELRDESHLWTVLEAIGPDSSQVFGLSKIFPFTQAGSSSVHHVSWTKQGAAYVVPFVSKSTTSPDASNSALLADHSISAVSVEVSKAELAVLLMGSDLLGVHGDQTSAVPACNGWTLLLPRTENDGHEDINEVVGALFGKNAATSQLVLGEEEREALRVYMGRPSASGGAEISNNTNPLEVGLMHTIHFGKGCYVGQEIISKAVSTNSTRRRLVGLRVVQTGGVRDERIPIGCSLLDEDGDVVGEVTSAVPTRHSGAVDSSVFSNMVSLMRSWDWGLGREGHPTIGWGEPEICSQAYLAMLSRSQSTPGTTLRVASPSLSSAVTTAAATLHNLQDVIATVEVVALSFPRYETQHSPFPPVPRAKTRGQAIIDPLLNQKPADQLTEEEKRRAAKLKALADKVAALQQKKKES